MTNTKQFIIGSILLFCLSSATSAQQAGFDLLTIGPDAKTLGLNGTVSAELLGAASLYTNPANLVLENSSSLNASYTLWIGDLTHTHAGVNLRKGSRALAFGFLGSQVDGIPLRGNQPGPPDGSFTVSSISLSGAYAYKVGPLALGATLQYLREEYYIYNASGYAVNVGASSRIFNERIQIGATLLNLGSMDELRNEATTLPMTFRAGYNAELFTFTPPENQNLPISVFLKSDVVVPIKSQSGTTQGNNDTDPFASLAVEFDIANTIALRSGYRTGNTVRHWSAGASINVESFSVDYALIPFETGFGTAHSIGISYKF